MHQQELKQLKQQVEMLMKEIKIMKEESANIVKAKIEKKLQKKQKQIK